MKVSLNHEPNDFLERSFGFLDKHEAENCLMLSLLDQLKSNKHLFGNESPRFFTIEDLSIQALAMQTPPYNLILSTPFQKEAVRHLILFLKQQNIKIPGVIGSKEIVKKFSQEWVKENNLSSQILVHERIYRLDKINPLTLVENPREFIQAYINELDLILNWTLEFNKEANPEDDSGSYEDFKLNQIKSITAAIEDGQFYLLKDQSHHVCMAKSPGKTVNGRMINYVYTPPKYRRHGFATTCVAKLCQKLLVDGYTHCTLFTDLSNPTSNSIYQKIGFKPVDDVNMIKFISHT